MVTKDATITIYAGILTRSGMIFRRAEIIRLENTKTAVVDSPMPTPLTAVVVTAQVGHIPSIRANVGFSLLFGGGARYSNGEDSLFLHDCLKKGLHIYADTAGLGREVYRESTWFHGYNEKFFADRGVLYYHLYGALASLFAMRFLVVHGVREKNGMLAEIPFGRAYGWMREGMRQAKARK